MNRPKITVRPAQAADLPLLCQATYQLPLLTRYGVTEAGLLRDLSSALQQGEGLLVANENDTAPLGFAWFLPVGTLAQGGYLRLIACAQEAQGQGIGKALLKEVEFQVAQASRWLFLLVSDFNLAAQRFYQREGYTHLGSLPDFARPGITELLYGKNLLPSPLER